ncbi:MAG: helix-turn-helix domain-containing protein, partial [Microscillaceae bacterium]|nr:helix-turn-helix domain-containing protein [Microscillaceae bacterium]
MIEHIMNPLPWRKKLGLSQEEMANYLQISRSLLSMVETGRRALPTPAHLRLAELILQYEKPGDAPKRPREENEKRAWTLQKQIQHRIARLNLEIERRKERLAQWEMQYKTAQKKMQILLQKQNQRDGL